MSCIITYNGQNFTQEDFLEYLKSQIATSNIKKPGVEEIFQENKSIKLPSSYKGIPIIQGPINTLKNTPVAARYRKSEGVIYADIEQIQEKFKNKAWTNPALQKDGSYATALPENQFTNITDFTKFILEHEFAHSHIFKQEGETTGQYEDRINQEALKQTFQEDNISNLDTYQYYGKTYQIHTVDGVGVKVEGYMGSNAKQQTLLAAYNNKDVDPQTGRKFRNLSPLQELEQKITGIGTSTVVKKEFSFTHNDVTIPTDFQLGEQQEEALKQIIDFIEGNSERAGEPFFTLQGFAGTGKTTVIGYVQKYFEAKKSRLAFRYVAPTHAATAQLAVTTSRLGNTMLPSTVRSSIFEKKDLVTGDIIYSIARKLKIGDFDTPIFIVDETSMLPQKDLDLLIKAVQDKGGKVVFMGDSKQIPEVIVGSNQSKTMNSAFQTENTLVLDRVYRQSTSDLLDTLTDIRNKNYFEPSINPTKNDGSLQNLNISEYNNTIIQDFQNDLENTVYIAYTNVAVSEFNRSIKSVLNGEKEPIVGEKIVGYLGYGTKQIENREVANSISYVIQDIKRVSSELSIFRIEAFSNLLGDLKKLGVKGVTGEAYAQYVQLSSEDSFQFDEITKEQMDETNKFISAKLSKLYKEHLEILARPNHGSKWAALELNKANISDVLSKYQLGNTYVFNPETETLVLKHLMDPKKYTKILKDIFTVEKGIDYGYGITAHKAQGMTVNNAYVDVENISKYGTETPIMVKGEQVNTEKNALYYVAMSRAKNKVVVKKGVSNVQKQNTVSQKETVTSKPQSKEFITNKVNSSFDKYGYVDVLTSGKNNFDFKSAVIKYILKDLGLEFKSDTELNNYLIKEKNEGRTFNLMQYVTLEELPDNKTRVKLNKRNLLLDSVEDFGPRSLGGLNFTSSGRDFESKNIFKNNIEQAFNCK